MYIEFNTLFECDPVKNRDCRKTGCFINGGPCHMTNKLKYARVDSPTGYAENQKRQTADLYARVDVTPPGAADQVPEDPEEAE